MPCLLGMEGSLQSLFQKRQSGPNRPQHETSSASQPCPCGRERAPSCQIRGVKAMSVILITGALTGIGRATALAFAREGATVVVSGRREAEGKALEAELRGLGAQAAFVRADVRHEGDVSNVGDQTIAR